MRGGCWARLSHGTLGTGALGSLVLFWSNRREFAGKQEAGGALGLPGGDASYPSPHWAEGQVSAPPWFCCAGKSCQRCSPSSDLHRRVVVLVSRPKSSEEETRQGWGALPAPSLGGSAPRRFCKGNFCFSSARLGPGSGRGCGAEPGTAAPPARTCRRLSGTASPTLRGPTAP